MKKSILFLLLLLSLINLSGCWGSKDLIQKSIVVAVGLDKAADNTIELTLQLVNPSSFNTEHSISEPRSTVSVISTTGPTIFEAVRAQLTSVGRKPFYSHVQIIVIGEELAKEGLNDILDFFERDSEPRLTARVLIAKNITAKEILSAKSQLETIPAVHLQDVMRNNHVSDSTIRDVQLIDLLKTSDGSGKNPSIGAIEALKKSNPLYITDMKITGCAVFKKGKLAGWLNPQETIGLSYTENKAKNTIIHISNPLSLDKAIIIEQFRYTVKKQVDVQSKNFKGIIDVNAIGSIGEIQGSADFSSPDFIQKLNKATETSIKEQILSTIKASQENFQSDIFGFGEIIKRKHNEVWMKSQENWDEIFSSMPIDVNVKFTIKRPGIITNPSKFD